MVSYMRLLAVALLSALAFIGVCLAGSEDDGVSGYEEAFDMLRESRHPESSGTSVEDILEEYARGGEVTPGVDADDIRKEMGEGGEVREGTYLPSEIWDHHFDIRRVKPDSISYSGQVFAKYSEDDETDVTKWEKQFELSMAYGDWDAYLRWSDVNTFAKNDDPFRWEKGRVRYKTGDVKITAGSFSQLFGRGLALNLFEDPFLEHDNELEGVKIESELGPDTELVALWGTRKNRDEAHHSEVGAARVEVDLGDNLTIGAHGAKIEFPDTTYSAESPNMIEYDAYGGDATLKAGPVKIYTEVVRLERDELEYGGDFDMTGKTGKGYYIDASVGGKGYSLSVEYKDYRGLQQPFSVLPPIRRWSDAATATPDDEKGFGVHTTLLPFKDDSSIELGYVQDNAHEKGFPFTEAMLIYSSSPMKSTSFIAEYWHVNDLNTIHKQQKLTVNRQLNEDWVATMFGERENIDSLISDPYYDYILSGELAYKSKANVIYTYETTKKEDVDKSNWGLWELKIKPDPNQEFNLVYGSRRESFVCSGGICRLEPAFDGVKLDYLLRF